MQWTAECPTRALSRTDPLSTAQVAWKSWTQASQQGGRSSDTVVSVVFRVIGSKACVCQFAATS